MEQNKENKIEEKLKEFKRFIHPEDADHFLIKKIRQALHEVGEQEYTKGFNDGANLTGRMSEEVTADKIEQARQEERKRIKKEIDEHINDIEKNPAGVTFNDYERGLKHGLRTTKNLLEENQLTDIPQDTDK